MRTRFAAKYVGICDACREPFPVGTMVSYNQQGRIEHVSCPDDPMEDLDDVDPRTACIDCHLVHAAHQKECW